MELGREVLGENVVRMGGARDAVVKEDGTVATALRNSNVSVSTSWKARVKLTWN